MPPNVPRKVPHPRRGRALSRRSRRPAQFLLEQRGRTILDVVLELLPTGTRKELLVQEVGTAELMELVQISRVLLCPYWPADVFAVAATLMELSGCYADAIPVEGHHDDHADYINEVMDAAGEWQKTGICPPAVESWWSDLILAYGQTTVADICDAQSNPFPTIVALLMRLLSASDEASAGVGWVPRAGEPYATSAVVERATASFLKNVGAAVLPYVPRSLCEMVPPDKATVLPKSLTPSVGCTIRSMSHHLALLPSSSEVESQWVLPDNGPANDMMRLLVIPYPFRVDDESFVSTGPLRELVHDARMHPYFGLSPTWLERPTTVTATMLRDELIAPLIASAERKFGAGTIDGVLFPECALTKSLADELQALLSQNPIPGLKFLITGTTSSGEPSDGDSAGVPGRNDAVTMLFASGTATGDGPLLWRGSHSKHHRWALDSGQIRRYGLTGVDAPNGVKVWEHIVVGQRRLPFLALRDDLCMTVLICEDLARADPAMPVIRSVGPNLVVALLMDGPQLASRWPGRYATVLAEDPGSSVLTITSAGMVDRSNLGERTPARAIGLWRHEQGANTELYLPPGHHGLVLTVKAEKERQFSLDHRSDRTATRRWSLQTVTPLAAQADWL